VNALPIDPKAPRSSPQHPANWRRVAFREPGVILAGDYEPQPLDAPPPGGTPVAEETKPAASKPTRKPATRKRQTAVADLDAALAKLGKK
jgi:hypothetical protein